MCQNAVCLMKKLRLQLSWAVLDSWALNRCGEIEAKVKVCNTHTRRSPPALRAARLLGASRPLRGLLTGLWRVRLRVLLRVGNVNGWCAEDVWGRRVRRTCAGWWRVVVKGVVDGREGGGEGGGGGERDGKNGKGGEGVSGEWLDLTTELTT